MTPNEIILFKEMIKECVRDVVKDELASHKETLKKDLKEVKLLMVGIIKEARKHSSSDNILTEETKGGLISLLNKKPLTINKPRPGMAKNPVASILEQTAREMTSQDVRAFTSAPPADIELPDGGAIYDVTAVYADEIPVQEEFIDEEPYEGPPIPNFGSMLEKMNEASKNRQG